MTINGYIGGLNGGNNWMTWNPDPEFIMFLSSLLNTSDTLSLGRKTAEDIIKYWGNEAKPKPRSPICEKNSGYSKGRLYQNAQQINLVQHYFGKRRPGERNCRLRKTKRQDIALI